MGDKAKGLYKKFSVQRTDGSHSDCQYFVLDVDHDPLALPALDRYSKLARREGYGMLAYDLDALLRERGYDPTSIPNVDPITYGYWCTECQYFEGVDDIDDGRCRSCGCAEHVHQPVAVMAR